MVAYRCVWANDNNKYACHVYRKNFGAEELVEADLQTVHADQIPDHDLLTAGFPCQSFSVAEPRKGFQDTRGTLFFDIARVIQAKRPPLLLLENVKGLLSAKAVTHNQTPIAGTGGYVFTRILHVLEDLGYDVEWQVLNSKHYGVPQNRERVFLVGHLRGTGSQQIFPLESESRNIIRTCEEAQGKRPRVSSTVYTRSDRGDATYIAEPFPLRFLNRNQKTFGEIAMTVDPTNSTGLQLFAVSSSGRGENYAEYRESRIKLGEANALQTMEGNLQKRMLTATAEFGG